MTEYYRPTKGEMLSNKVQKIRMTSNTQPQSRTLSNKVPKIRMTSNTLAKGRTLSNKVQKITITSNGDKRSECYRPTTGQMLSNKVH